MDFGLYLTDKLAMQIGANVLLPTNIVKPISAFSVIGQLLTARTSSQTT